MTKKNKVESNNQLPRISVYKRKISPSGTVLEDESYCITGKSLSECRKHYDELIK